MMMLLLLNHILCFSVVVVVVYGASTLDMITSNMSLKDGDILVSPSQQFALGFFSPKDSTNRYVGIFYYNLSEQAVVWVANRNISINGSEASGILTIESDGNLVIYGTNESKVALWSSNVISLATTNNVVVVAKLMDSGNLVLFHGERQVWQSFDDSTNTEIPLKKIGINYATGLNLTITCWSSYNDPAPGKFTIKMDPSGLPQFFVYNGSARWWRVGSWTGKMYTGAPGYTPSYIKNDYIDNENETYAFYNLTDDSVKTRLVLSDSGITQRLIWSDQNLKWTYSSGTGRPNEQCDYYEHCGPNSNCNSYNANEFECTCLPGFEPKSAHDWYDLSDGSGGCVRKTGATTCTSGEGFVRIQHVKIPDTSAAVFNMTLNLKACKFKCLKDCSCVAYATAQSDNDQGCLMWYGNLTDTRIFSNMGQDLYVRVDAAELARYKKKGSLRKKLAAILVPSVLAIIFVVASFHWLVKRRKGRRRKQLLSVADNFVDSLLDDAKRKFDLPLFDLSIIVKATDNFSPNNKLGEGGFGPVYKGVLPNGLTIAVKRLSETSRQGTIEFKNEIALLAKLQHRNLVKIHGYCIDQDEKMLVYEFLANKSLDSFIFDETNRSLLNWSMLLEIIQGVARGISYLHHDSRLRIIHRDLKASNILLDAVMNPKVSDFGMAKIFGGDNAPARTNRVVGTYGYMSPEYAMQGRFSIKSDVYSFGILLLEILTGRRNTVYYSDGPSSTLVGYVWGLWEKDESLDMISSKLKESFSVNEARRCIQIGLLCVQDQPTDRPEMSEVVSMLSTDHIPLSIPKKSPFIANRSNHSCGSACEGTISVNGVTVSNSILLGR